MVLITQTLFRIRRIEIIGSDIKISIDPKKLGTLLPFIATSSIANEIRFAHPELSQVEIYKKYPGTLVLDLVSKTPMASVAYENGYAMVDETGFVLSSYQESKPVDIKPILYGCTVPIVVNQKITDIQCVHGLTLIRALFNAGENITELTIRDREYYQFKLGKSDIFIAHDADIPGIVTTLQTIMNRFRMKGTTPARINLRFAKPVVEM